MIKYIKQIHYISIIIHVFLADFLSDKTIPWSSPDYIVNLKSMNLCNIIPSLWSISSLEKLIIAMALKPFLIQYKSSLLQYNV